MQIERTQERAHILSKRPNLERYQYFMNLGLPEKVQQTLPYLTPYLSKADVRGLSIGAGTGAVELSLGSLLSSESQLIAVDLSLPMLETIQGQVQELPSGEPRARLQVVQADALRLPFPPQTFEFILATSMIHELASFEDNYQFGETIETFFQQLVDNLKPGGRLVIRDFMQPERPDEIVGVCLGKEHLSGSVLPLDFVEKFVESFPGEDLRGLRRQIQAYKDSGYWQPGVKLWMTAATALEVLIHGSWAQSFEEEVRERYAYMTACDYAKYIISVCDKVGIETKVIAAQTHLQEGYRTHLKDRLDLTDTLGNPKDFSPFTGVVVIERV